MNLSGSTATLADADSAHARRPPGPDSEPVVFIVDDDGPVREALARLLHAAGWQTRTFDCASAFLAHPRGLRPACLVIEVTLPDINGVDVLLHLAAQGSDLPVLMVSRSSDVPTTVRAMKAGAIDFVLKPVLSDALLAAIPGAIERSRRGLLRDAEVRLLRQRYASLTRREREVMERVILGRLNKQMAYELEITEFTVKVHRGNMIHKMHARSVPDLVHMAARLATTNHVAA